ncbi:MAG: ATPase [Waddliaceae bacterium]|nr:ATPase [Waddliaceae bacterium]
MKRKTFVLDTNVLIHDPLAASKFPRSDVVIPVSVLEELDSKKRSPDEIGRNARLAIRFIDGLRENRKGDLHAGVDFENDAKLRIHLDKKSDIESCFPLNPNTNKILCTAYALKKKGEHVVFVSKDFAARVKAEAIELEAEDYENLKVSYEALSGPIRKIEVPKVTVDTFLKDGGVILEGQEFVPNEYCTLHADEQNSVLAKFDSRSGAVQPLLPPGKLWGISPRNVEQRCAIDLLLRDEIKLVALIGAAGTGKTLLALACALQKVFDEGVFSKILVSRPIVALGKDIGYLPGSKEEKLFHWMQPIYDNLEVLCSSTGDETGETLRWITESNKLEMEAVTYIRGRSLPRAFIIIDEAQNLTPHQVKTVISRAGAGSKVILAGDATQIDHPYLDKDSNGLIYTVGRFAGKSLFGAAFLEKTERSELAALAAEVL